MSLDVEVVSELVVVVWVVEVCEEVVLQATPLSASAAAAVSATAQRRSGVHAPQAVVPGAGGVRVGGGHGGKLRPPASRSPQGNLGNR